jgi:RimJ/RimL family protein N-acetyltransferase
MQPILKPEPGMLTGRRIILRGYTDEDAPALHAAVQESIEHLRPWMSWWNSNQSIDDTLLYIRSTQAEWTLRRAFHTGIFRTDGRFLGACSLHADDWDVPCLMVGYWLRQSEEGKGYMTEAVTLLVRCAFEDLGAERVWLYCDARNQRSMRVAERLGFVLEGTTRRAGRDTSGRLADRVNYSVLREEYESRQHGPQP